MAWNTAPAQHALLSRLLAYCGALVIGMTMVPASPAVAATHRVRAPMFGVHDGSPATWPKARVGAIRLWDSGVTWREIETRLGSSTSAGWTAKSVPRAPMARGCCSCSG